LLVGLSFARALSFALNKTLVEVNHIKAHLYANFLSYQNQTKKSMPKIKVCSPTKLPVIGLVVSGGHTSLYLIKKFKDFKLLGKTLDDAAGEAFDKVAKILDLGYPGGPLIDDLAKKGKKTKLKFSCAILPGTSNFSFSGIKTAVLYHCRDKVASKTFSQADVAYAFQESVVNTLVKKCIAACHTYKISSLVVGGGVAANSFLRKRLLEESEKNAITVYFPPISLCMDNAAMIAGLGYHYCK